MIIRKIHKYEVSGNIFNSEEQARRYVDEKIAGNIKVWFQKNDLPMVGYLGFMEEVFKHRLELADLLRVEFNEEE